MNLARLYNQSETLAEFGEAVALAAFGGTPPTVPEAAAPEPPLPPGFAPLVTFRDPSIGIDFDLTVATDHSLDEYTGTIALVAPELDGANYYVQVDAYEAAALLAAIQQAGIAEDIAAGLRAALARIPGQPTA